MKYLAPETKSSFMFPNFLPQTAVNLTESTSINLLQSLEQIAVATTLSQQEIATTYVRAGSGNTPILLLHGFDSSVLEFRHLLPFLAKNQEVWAVDLLGFGFTQRVAGLKFSAMDIKTHLYSFWQNLINQPVILVGASMGGAAAIDFTLTYPDIVEKLVLIDSAGLTGSSPVGKFLFPPFDYLATEFLRNPKVRQSISKAAYQDKSFASEDAQLCAALHLEMPDWSQALVAFTKSGGYKAFRFKQLGNISKPTLILWGDSDNILGIKDAPRFRRAIPGSELCWIKNCGHVPHLEQPQVTAEKILNFLVGDSNKN